MSAPRIRSMLVWSLALAWLAYSGAMLGWAAYVSPASDLCITTP